MINLAILGGAKREPSSTSPLANTTLLAMDRETSWDFILIFLKTQRQPSHCQTHTKIRWVCPLPADSWLWRPVAASAYHCGLCDLLGADPQLTFFPNLLLWHFQNNSNNRCTNCHPFILLPTYHLSFFSALQRKWQTSGHFPTKYFRIHKLEFNLFNSFFWYKMYIKWSTQILSVHSLSFEFDLNYWNVGSTRHDGSRL